MIQVTHKCQTNRAYQHLPAPASTCQSFNYWWEWNSVSSADFTLFVSFFIVFHK